VIKPSLAFIDHSFHQKSKSGDFLREIFREHFNITDYWDDSWKGGSTVPPEDINKHDYAFYFQVLNPIPELKKIKVPILWAPMYDGVKFNYIYWKSISLFDIKILSFSKRISDWLYQFSIPTLPLQYYIRPLESPTTSENRIFFWYRGDIRFNDIQRIINPDQIKELTYFENPDKDGCVQYISKEDLERFKVKLIAESFLPKDVYKKLVSGSSIFIAPRKKEGIGMSFIEALSMGKCVIGYRDATLDEYITDGIDGILFDEQTKKVDFGNIEMLRDTAYRRYNRGYEKWLSDREKIIPFMTEPYHTEKSELKILLWGTLNSISAFYRKVRYYVTVKTQKNI
jgi:hypothetical protein